MSQKNSAKGFALVEVVIVVLVVAILATGAWFVWHKKQEPTPKPSSQTQNKGDQAKGGQQEPAQKVISLLDGKVNFADDGTWKVAAGGYFSIENGRCGRGPDFDPGCLDTKMLIPATETFTNPDQFQVNIAVFKNDAPGTALGEWVDSEVGPGGTNPKRSHPTLDGHEAYRYEVAYDENDVRLVYGIAVDDKIVVIRSDFFKGDHGSYKTTNDYLPFITQVDKLVGSINIR